MDNDKYLYFYKLCKDSQYELDKYKKNYDKLMIKLNKSSNSNLQTNNISIYTYDDDDTTDDLIHILKNLNKINKKISDDIYVKHKCVEINDKCNVFEEKIQNMRTLFKNNVNQIMDINAHLIDKKHKNKKTEHFGVGDITGGLTKGVSGIMDILKTIIDLFKEMVDQVKNIGAQIAQLGEKISVVLQNVLKQIFGIMITVFDWINKEVIPIMKILMEFLLKVITVYIPQGISWMTSFLIWVYRVVVQIAINYANCSISPVLLFIFVFFGIQMYTKYLTGLAVPVPLIPTAIFGLVVVLHQLYYNIAGLQPINDQIESIIISIFTSSFVTNLFKINLTPEIRGNKVKLLMEISAIVSKNWPYFLVCIMLLLITIKIVINFIFRNMGKIMGINEYV
jgi:hypothetical protein